MCFVHYQEGGVTKFP